MPERDMTRVREAVGVFDDVASLETAIDSLQEAGFDRADISLLAGEHAVEQKLGHIYAKVAELEDDPRVPREAYIARESLGAAEGALVGAPMYIAACTAAGLVAATGGALGLVIASAAAAAGGGAVIGGLLASMVGKHHAHYIEDQLEHGGLVLWVRTWNADQETRAKEILGRTAARDVHVHDLYGDDTNPPSPAQDERKKPAPPAPVTAAGFSTPEEILKSPTLDRDAKIRLLCQWEYDAREQDVAEEEGMAYPRTHHLQSILRALHTLGSGPDLEHAPPTKQGGI